MEQRKGSNRYKSLWLCVVVLIVFHNNDGMSDLIGSVMAWTTASLPRRKTITNKPKDAWLLRMGTNSNNSDGEKLVVVVGGGVGGLAISSRIASSAASNTRVVLLEQNEQVGGRCGSFISYRDEKDGEYRHERGPSLLLLPQVYKDLFHDCTRSASSCEDFGLEMKQCLPAYQVVFEDGDAISVGMPENYDNTMMMENQMNSYEPNGAQKWKEYMETCAAFLDCGLPNFIEERLDLSTFPAFLQQALKDNAKSWPLLPHSTVLDSTFASTKMKALASFQDLYVGLEPYANPNKFAGGVFSKTAPAVFGLLSALELHPINDKAGVFAPIGGFQSVTNSFEKLATSFGVDIQCNRTVTGINETHVTYITNDGTIYHQHSDLTIINADLPYATKTLLEINDTEDDTTAIPKFDWDDSYEFSSGVVAFHWCIQNKALANNDILRTHNVFLVASSDEAARDSWNVVRTNTNEASSYQKGVFNFYVHCPTATDTTAAPPNCDSITILVPCPTLQRNKNDANNYSKQEVIKKYKEQFTESFIDVIRSSVLKRLSVLKGLEDIQKHIVHEVVDTPVTYSNSYNLAAGTPFGLSHGFNQLSLTRPGAQSTKYDNVLFVGASSRPGNGVPLVLLGAKSVAQKALKKL